MPACVPQQQVCGTGVGDVECWRVLAAYSSTLQMEAEYPCETWSLYELYGSCRSQRVCCHRRENLQSAFFWHSVTGASCKFLPSLLINDLSPTIHFCRFELCDVLCQFRSSIISPDKPFATFHWLACPSIMGHSPDRPLAGRWSNEK